MSGGFGVFVIIAVGLPFTVFARSNAFINSSILCPSTFITLNPKLLNLLSIGYGFITSPTCPSICKSLLSTITQRLSSL